MERVIFPPYLPMSRWNNTEAKIRTRGAISRQTTMYPSQVSLLLLIEMKYNRGRRKEKADRTERRGLPKSQGTDQMVPSGRDAQSWAAYLCRHPCNPLWLIPFAIVLDFGIPTWVQEYLKWGWKYERKLLLAKMELYRTSWTFLLEPEHWWAHCLRKNLQRRSLVSSNFTSSRK